MNDNQNDRQQLHCALHTVASESLSNSIALDLQLEDKNLKEFIEEQENGIQDSSSSTNRTL